MSPQFLVFLVAVAGFVLLCLAAMGLSFWWFLLVPFWAFVVAYVAGALREADVYKRTCDDEE